MITIELKDDGKTFGLLLLSPKTFKTGSVGYYTQGKLEFAGRRYQTQVQLVEIGSKPVGEAPGGQASP